MNKYVIKYFFANSDVIGKYEESKEDKGTFSERLLRELELNDYILIDNDTVINSKEVIYFKVEEYVDGES